MDDFMIFLISMGLTALGLFASWGAYRKRGVASGMRGASWSLVPLAAYMTGLTTWLADFVFSPLKWAGLAVASLAVVMYLASGVMLRKRTGEVDEGGSKKAAKGSSSRAVEPRKQSASGVDPDLADIEDILRNRGIN